MRNLLVLLIFLPTLCLAQTPQYVPSEGLEVWYDFSGTLDDKSGNGNHLQYHPPEDLQWAFQPNIGPTNGPSFYLHGDSTAIPIGSFPYSTGTWPLEFSIAGWHFPYFTCNRRLINTSPADSMVLFRLDIVPPDPPSLDPACYLGRTKVTHKGGPIDLELYSGNLSWEWHHYAVVFESRQDSTFNPMDLATLYIDGLPVDSGPYLSQQIIQVPPVGPIIDWELDTDFSGQIGELGIWNRPLSATEVMHLYTGSLSLGCTDSSACNFFPDATMDNGNCIPPGCTDTEACNLNPEATIWYCSDTCIYPIAGLPDCFSGSISCGDGTIWDSAQQRCVALADTVFKLIPSCGTGTIWNPTTGKCEVAIPADLNYDGCITIGDLLNLLTVHGTCPPLPDWSQVPADSIWVPIWGCTDSTFLEFSPQANEDDGSCQTLLMPGCTDELFLEFSPSANVHDGSCQTPVIAGCTDSLFLEFNPQANVDDGSCSTQDQTPWSCGDPIDYWFHSYETVQIADQCWFKENLRTNWYRNGDVIHAPTTASDWAASEQGSTTTYGSYDSPCTHIAPTVEACNPDEALLAYGKLYNWHAVIDPRGLCPSSWSVSSESDWEDLLEHVYSISSSSHTVRQLRAVGQWHLYFSWNEGTDLVGFSALPNGVCASDGSFGNAGDSAFLWTNTSSEDNTEGMMVYLFVNSMIANIWSYSPELGAAIRCIKD